MRCPKCGTRPDEEFRKLKPASPGVDARLVAVTVYEHKRSTCRAWVYKVGAKRIMAVA